LLNLLPYLTSRLRFDIESECFGAIVCYYCWEAPTRPTTNDQPWCLLDAAA